MYLKKVWLDKSQVKSCFLSSRTLKMLHCLEASIHLIKKKKSSFHYYPCSPTLVFPPLQLSLWSFFFIPVWQQFDYDVTDIRFSCNYTAWNSWSFVIYELLSFINVWNYFSTISSKVCFSVPFFLSSQVTEALLVCFQSSTHRASRY